MTSERIKHIDLEESAKVNRSPHIMNEYNMAVDDLLQENFFTLQPLLGRDAGPYQLLLKINDGKLVMDVICAEEQMERIIIPVSPFRTIIRDYFMICESYYKALKQMLSSQVQTIDMARRSLHNEGSEKLQKLLEHAVKTDADTARRIFTLVCVLHIRLGSMVGE